MRITAKLSPEASAAYLVLAAHLEVPTDLLIAEALDLFWRIAKGRSEGERYLLQRGDVIADLDLPILDGLVIYRPSESDEASGAAPEEDV